MLFKWLVEVGNNGVRIAKLNEERIFKWTEIVGVSRLDRGFIFLRNGERMFTGDYSVFTVHDYGEQDIGAGSYTVHCGWTNFTQILKENIVAHGGTYIEEFEGLYMSYRFSRFIHSNWKKKLSPEEAKDRKILISGCIFFVFLWLYGMVIKFTGIASEDTFDIWWILLVVFFIGFWFTGLILTILYSRQSKTDKILQRYFPKVGVGNNE